MIWCIETFYILILSTSNPILGYSLAESIKKILSVKQEAVYF